MGYRHNPETGQREFVEDDAPAGQSTREPGWVEMFLGPNEHGLPLRSLPHPSRHISRRPTRRPTRPRG